MLLGRTGTREDQAWVGKSVRALHLPWCPSGPARCRTSWPTAMPPTLRPTPARSRMPRPSPRTTASTCAAPARFSRTCTAPTGRANWRSRRAASPYNECSSLCVWLWQKATTSTSTENKRTGRGCPSSARPQSDSLTERSNTVQASASPGARIAASPWAGIPAPRAPRGRGHRRRA
jgi:hypothetical protein